jgi:hypothetical protein
MYCPKCGTQLPNVAKFCIKCGRPLPKAAIEAHRGESVTPATAEPPRVALIRNGTADKAQVKRTTAKGGAGLFPFLNRPRPPKATRVGGDKPATPKPAK